LKNSNEDRKTMGEFDEKLVIEKYVLSVGIFGYAAKNILNAKSFIFPSALLLEPGEERVILTLLNFHKIYINFIFP